MDDIRGDVKVGREFVYLLNGEFRTARCTGIEWHFGLKKRLFHGISSRGNRLKLTSDEILYWK